MNLYQITGEYLSFQNWIEDEELDEQAIADTLESLDAEFEDKAEGYAKVIRNIEGQISVYKSEEKRLADARRSMESKVQRLKDALQDAMKKTGKTRFDGQIFKFSLVKAGGKAPLIIDADIAELPDEFVKISKAPDNENIRAYIEEHGECKYAHLAERKTSLRIK